MNFDVIAVTCENRLRDFDLPVAAFRLAVEVEDGEPSVGLSYKCPLCDDFEVVTVPEDKLDAVVALLEEHKVVSK